MIRELSISGIAMAMFCSSAAFAADLPVQPPVYVPPAFTWTGFYFGDNLGFGGDRFVYPFSAAAVDGSAGFGGSVSITSNCQCNWGNRGRSLWGVRRDREHNQLYRHRARSRRLRLGSFPRLRHRRICLWPGDFLRQRYGCSWWRRWIDYRLGN